MSPFYINKKGKEVSLRVTYHAKLRFIQRCRKLKNEDVIKIDCTKDNVDEIIARYFNDMASLKQNLNKTTMKRKKKHGSDTLYFNSRHFTFIVQNATIVTIELRGEYRKLNKKKTVLR